MSRWEGDIKMNLKQMGWESVDWMKLAEIWFIIRVCCLYHGIEIRLP
jgi:hypothetical protein